MEQGFDDNDIPPLPPNKTAVDIFGDLLKYLYQSTKQYIWERQGDSILDSVGDNISFVLSHPNGWEGKEQSQMRRAAIVAGLVANMSEALERVDFVTEGEASLHFCLNKIPTALEKYVSPIYVRILFHAYAQANDGVSVVDCGGGTVDISTYARSSDGHFREIAPAECNARSCSLYSMLTLPSSFARLLLCHSQSTNSPERSSNYFSLRNP